MNHDQQPTTPQPIEPVPQQAQMQQPMYPPQQPYFPADPQQGYGYAPVQPKQSKLKFALLGVGLALLLAVSGGSYYAFAYLPNTPENVWRRGMASIGVGLTELNESDMLKTSAATKSEGTFTMTKPIEMTAKVDATSTTEGEGTFGMEVTYDKYNPKIEAYSNLLDGDDPQLFFKFSNVEPLLNDFVGEDTMQTWFGSEGMDGTWWLLSFNEMVERGYIDQAELDKMLSDAEGGDITADDYTKVAQAMINASNKYIFTSEEADMVFQRKDYLGEEAYENVMSKKYRVEVNRENLKKYLMTLRDEIDATGVPKKVSTEFDLKAEISDAEINTFVDELELDKVQIDGWVSSSNKVLRNLRFASTEEGENVYIDVSLLLDDTNLERIPMRILIKGDDKEASGEVTLRWTADFTKNMSEFLLNGDIDFKDEASSDVAFSGSLTFTGLDEAPAFEKPATTKSVIEFLDGFNQQMNSPTTLQNDDLMIQPTQLF